MHPQGMWMHVDSAAVSAAADRRWSGFPAFPCGGMKASAELSTSSIKENCPRLQELLDCRCGSRDPVPRQDERRGFQRSSSARRDAHGRETAAHGSAPSWPAPRMDLARSWRNGCPLRQGRRNADEDPRMRRSVPAFHVRSLHPGISPTGCGKGRGMRAAIVPCPATILSTPSSRRRRSGTGDGPMPRLSTLSSISHPCPASRSMCP